MTESHSPDGDYVVVARRYRPQQFDELIGQGHVATALCGAIENDRVGHAYLFTGARGVGKTSAARILAKALNCEQGVSPRPCNECEICQTIASGDDVDVLEIDGASNRGIDEIRQLRQNVAVRPSRARLKIYIIDEVHMLTKEAFNALLKTLEEPPEHVKFIFATTEPNKIPITILSRCQRYDFAGVDAAAIEKRLAQIAECEGANVDSEALQILAMRAAGSMRDGQSLLEQLLATGGETITASDVTSLLGIAPAARLTGLVQALVERNAAVALVELDAAIADGAEVGQLIDQLLGYFRDAMTQAVGCDACQMLHALPAQGEEIRKVADQLGIETLLAIGQILDQTASRMRLSTQVRTLAEMAIVRICQLQDLDELAALLEQLRTGDHPAPPAGPAKKNLAAKPTPRDSAPKSSLTRNATKPAVNAAADVAVAPAPAPADGAAPAEALSADNVEQVWNQALASIDGMVANHAAAADEVAVDETGRLVLRFPQSRAFSRDACTRPANLAKIETAVAEVAGEPVRLHLDTHTRVDSESVSKPTIAGAQSSRRQQQAAAVSEPFVQKAMDLFEGDPSRIRYVPPEDKA